MKQRRRQWAPASLAWLAVLTLGIRLAWAQGATPAPPPAPPAPVVGQEQQQQEQQKPEAKPPDAKSEDKGEKQQKKPAPQEATAPAADGAKQKSASGDASKQEGAAKEQGAAVGAAKEQGAAAGAAKEQGAAVGAAKERGPAAGATKQEGSPASGQAAAPAGASVVEVEPPGESTPAALGAPVPDYNLKLRSIEERVNQLKEKIFQSKARLVQLQEVVLHGTITGAKAVLIHKNEMGSSFKLWRAQYALDGAPVFNRVDTGSGELDAQDEIEIFSGSIAPGNHQLSVYLEYHGHGYGVFSYLKGYKFKIKSSYTFNAEEGKVTTIRIVGYEKGGITTELKDRPTVRYDVETAKELRPAKPAPHDQSPSKPGEK